MEAEDIVYLIAGFFTCSIVPWVFVFIRQKPPTWEVEKSEVVVRIKSEQNEIDYMYDHMYLSEFLKLERTGSFEKKNSDVFLLFYTKKLLFNLTFLFSTLFLVVAVIMYFARIREVISYEIPFSQILNTGSNIDTFVFVCIASYLLFIPSLLLSFFCMRNIEDSLKILKNKKRPLHGNPLQP